MEANQQSCNGSDSVSRWEGLYNHLQDKVICTFPYSNLTTLRATSRSCRQIANRAVTALTLTKATAGPTHTLNLAARLPNLHRLTLKDPPKEHVDPFMPRKADASRADCFTEMELLHIFTVPGTPGPWTQLRTLDIVQCRNLTVLVVAAILRMVPNLQTLATWVPCSLHNAAPQAIAELKHLCDLTMLSHVDDGTPINAGDIGCLHSTTALQTLTLQKCNWQAIQAVGGIATLTQLVARTVLSCQGHSQNAQDPQAPSTYIPALAGLSQLAALELTEAVVNFAVLADALQDLAGLRKLHLTSIKNFQPDSAAQLEISSISKLQQLRDVKVEFVTRSSAEDFNHALLLIYCLQLVKLEVLRVGFVGTLVEGFYEELLSEPAPCAASLHTFQAKNLVPNLLDSQLLKSLRVKNMHLSFGYFQELQLGECIVQWLCHQTALQSLTLLAEEENPTFPQDIWARVGPICQSLRHLHLCFWEGYGPTFGLRHLAHVEDLYLNIYELEDNCTNELVYMPSLQSVQFHMCSRVSSLLLYGVAANQSVKKITVDDMAVKEEEVAAARKLLRQDLQIEFVRLPR